MFARPGDGRRPRLPLPCGRRKAGACAVRLAGKTQERGGPATVRSTLRAGRHAGVHLRVRRAAGHHFCGTHRADPPDLWKAAGLLRRLTRRACGRCLTGALRNARLWIARPGRGWPESASARSGGSGRAPAQVRSIRLRFAALAGCALAGSGVEIVRARAQLPCSRRGSGSRGGWRLPATRPTASARSRTGTRPATVHGVGRRAGTIQFLFPAPQVEQGSMGGRY